MKQGGAPPTGAWIGSPLGGVTSPDPVIISKPVERFAATAARLESLATDHAGADWLRFMAMLTRAQQVIAEAGGNLAVTSEQSLSQAVAAGMPPLAADGHDRDPTWRDGLTLLLASLDLDPLPPSARHIIDQLQGQTPAAIDRLADDFLSGAVASAEIGAVLFVAAALQVYFTRRAAQFDAEQIELLPERGLCPCCGSTPVGGVITGSGATPGTRYLYCSLCSTAWNHVRAACITCGESRSLALHGIEGDAGIVKAETCDECHTYAKMFYQAKDMKLDPYADDLASIGLDLMVAEAGWSRHAPNPFLL
jgi:FdhE protein